MKYFLQFIFISLFISFSLSSQNLLTQNVPLLKDRSLHSHFPKKPWEKSSTRPAHNQNFYQKTSSGVDTAWVRYYASGVIPSNDHAVKVAVDNDGNIFVTGTSDSSFTGSDYVTIKYDSLGNQKWIARYSSHENWDEARALALDAIGNVFVTGSAGTVKYNSGGQQQWVANEKGNAIAVDRFGSIYVVGEDGIAKMNTAGELLWVVDTTYGTILGSSYGSTYGSTLTVDQSGGVYITSTSMYVIDPYVYSFMITSKYDTNGKCCWASSYYGLPKSKNNPISIVVDKFGNSYVSGNNVGPGGYNSLTDIVTIKYDSSGIEQWVRIYNGSGQIQDFVSSSAIDDLGNIYVTGSSGGSVGVSSYYQDYVTIKYNSLGIQQWVARYNGKSNFDDNAEEVKVDHSGNVYVTGFSDWAYVTIKYDSSGIEQWVDKYKYTVNNWDTGNSLAVDKSGNVFIVGSQFGYSDYTTIKYNSSGIKLWISVYNGPGNSCDKLNAIAVDKIGNVYAAGSTASSSGGSLYDYDNDYILMKYNSTGVRQWVARYGSSNNKQDEATALTLDQSGNIYVTGKSDSNCVTIKYDPSGMQLWSAKINGGFYDEIPSIFIDPGESVYVNGSHKITKYDLQGNTLWQKDIGGSACTIDQTGNFYVANGAEGGPPRAPSYFITAKYNSNGNLTWITQSDSGEYCLPTAIVVDSTGNVYVTGWGWGLDDKFNVMVKYNSNGNKLWNRGIGISSPNSFTVDGNGSVYMMECVGGDYITIKYNASGDTVWVRSYKGTENSDDRTSSLLVDRSGNVYVTGSTGTVKYNSSGSQQWWSPYPASLIAIDQSENIIVAGTKKWEARSSGISVVKLKQIPTSVNNKISEVPSSFALKQNYPNPFNPSTTIRYAIPTFANVKLVIYDLLGREIATLVNEEQSAGWKEVRWNASNFASGMYFYQLRSEGFNQTKKLMLMK
ncbi:MAG: SBBP repeat-containing protein [Bacteroidota bacterium]